MIKLNSSNLSINKEGQLRLICWLNHFTVFCSPWLVHRRLRFWMWLERSECRCSLTSSWWTAVSSGRGSPAVWVHSCHLHQEGFCTVWAVGTSAVTHTGKCKLLFTDRLTLHDRSQQHVYYILLHLLSSLPFLPEEVLLEFDWTLLLLIVTPDQDHLKG